MNIKAWQTYRSMPPRVEAHGACPAMHCFRWHRKARMEMMRIHANPSIELSASPHGWLGMECWLYSCQDLLKLKKVLYGENLRTKRGS